MDGLSLEGITNRMKANLRQKMDVQGQAQRKNLLHLVAEFLRQQGLFNSLETFTEETQLSENFEVCDNVDLEIIFQDYSNYYHSRFNKWPKICKEVENHAPKENSTKSMRKLKMKPQKKIIEDSTDQEKSFSIPAPEINGFGLNVVSLTEKPIDDSNKQEIKAAHGNKKSLRSLSNLYPSQSEWREIAEVITREIVMTNLNVHWDDIYGLEDCKEVLKEAVIYPTKYPEFFSHLFTPWQGILLYGPPGTGKTMLAKAVATECDFTFFNITASSLVSKWRGDSEKYIRVLFELANFHAPSIIFIDEIDWIAAGVGSSCSDRSEPARRFRAELLSRVDGLKSTNDNHVILLAATNAPWDLDTALLRRLENHVLVNVPDDMVRRKILKTYTSENIHDEEQFNDVVMKTNGCSCADLKRICKKAWLLEMQPIWKNFEQESVPNTMFHLKRAKKINSCSKILEASNTVLCVANKLVVKYEEWKNNYQIRKFLLNEEDQPKSGNSRASDSEMDEKIVETVLQKKVPDPQICAERAKVRSVLNSKDKPRKTIWDQI